jgi:hypothetical protein
LFGRPFSHREKDRMRGCAGWDMTSMSEGNVMINRVEILDKIDAALGIAPQNHDESVAYPIIREIRNHHSDFLEKLIILEKKKSDIGIENLVLLEPLIEQTYSGKSIKKIILIVVEVREQLRKIMGLPTLTLRRS